MGLGSDGGRGPAEPGWRERALNAETALKAANTEILTQCSRIGELLGRIRDLETEWTQESIHGITAENTDPSAHQRQAHPRRRLQPLGRTYGSKSDVSPTWKLSSPNRRGGSNPPTHAHWGKPASGDLRLRRLCPRRRSALPPALDTWSPHRWTSGRNLAS